MTTKHLQLVPDFYLKPQRMQCPLGRKDQYFNRINVVNSCYHYSMGIQHMMESKQIILDTDFTDSQGKHSTLNIILWQQLTHVAFLKN